MKSDSILLFCAVVLPCILATQANEEGDRDKRMLDKLGSSILKKRMLDRVGGNILKRDDELEADEEEADRSKRMLDRVGSTLIRKRMLDRIGESLFKKRMLDRIDGSLIKKRMLDAIGHTLIKKSYDNEQLGGDAQEEYEAIARELYGQNGNHFVRQLDEIGEGLFGRQIEEGEMMPSRK